MRTPSLFSSLPSTASDSTDVLQILKWPWRWEGSNYSISGGVFAWKPHFVMSILWLTEKCQVAFTVELATPSGIISKSCGSHRVSFHRPWCCFSRSNQVFKLGENHRQKWKFEMLVFLAEIPGLWRRKGSCVCISSYCLCRTRCLQMLQKLLTSSCHDS